MLEPCDAGLCTAEGSWHLVYNLRTTRRALNVPMEVSHVATGFASAKMDDHVPVGRPTTRCQLGGRARQATGLADARLRSLFQPFWGTEATHLTHVTDSAVLAITAVQYEQLTADD